MQHHAFLAIENVAAARLLRRCRDISEVIARLPLSIGEGEVLLARGDRGNELLLLRRAAGKAEQAATQDHCREIGLEHEAAAEGLHDDHSLDRRAAAAAEV